MKAAPPLDSSSRQPSLPMISYIPRKQPDYYHRPEHRRMLIRMLLTHSHHEAREGPLPNPASTRS